MLDVRRLVREASTPRLMALNTTLSVRLVFALAILSLLCIVASAVAPDSKQKRRKRPIPHCAGTICSGVSASRQRVEVGDRVILRANATNPEVQELTYRWETTSGRILGAGVEVQFDSAGLEPGRYRVTAIVDDGTGLVTDCSVELELVPIGTLERDPASN